MVFEWQEPLLVPKHQDSTKVSVLYIYIYEIICVVTVALLSSHKQPVGLGKVMKDQQSIHLHPIPSGYIKVCIKYIKPGVKPPLGTTFDDE